MGKITSLGTRLALTLDVLSNGASCLQSVKQRIQIGSDFFVAAGTEIEKEKKRRIRNMGRKRRGIALPHLSPLSQAYRQFENPFSFGCIFYLNSNSMWYY